MSPSKLTTTTNLTPVPTSRVLSLLPTSLGNTIAWSSDLLTSGALLVVGKLLPALPKNETDMTGKVVVVTGGNSGIGLQIATDLARLGATVILACRNLSKAATAIDQILSLVPTAKGRVSARELDTSLKSSVQNFVKQWDLGKIDVLVNNAGIASSDAEFTKEGLETMYATNFLGSFLLTFLLDAHLAPDARVVFTSSTGQYGGSFAPDFALQSTPNVAEPGFHHPKFTLPVVGTVVARKAPETRYSNTKLMQVVFAKLLQRRYDAAFAKDKNAGKRTAHAFTPGFTFTPIFSKVTKTSIFTDPLFETLKATTRLATDVSVGAATGVWLASTRDESVWGEGGGYWDRMTRRVSGADVMPEETLEKFWSRWASDAGVEWR